MPAFGFKKRFVKPILAGRKTTTIRSLRKDGRKPCKPGDNLNFYTGLRTKNCRLFATAFALSIVEVVVDTDGIRPVERKTFLGDEVVIDADGVHPLNGQTFWDQDSLAKKEGFQNVKEFQSFFKELHKLPFHGHLITFQVAMKNE